MTELTPPVTGDATTRPFVPLYPPLVAHGSYEDEDEDNELIVNQIPQSYGNTTAAGSGQTQPGFMDHDTPAPNPLPAGNLSIDSVIVTHPAHKGSER